LQDASHIFICYSSKDGAIAGDVVTFLERRGLKCWISARDVPPGHNYQEVIVGALEAAMGIVFLFSENSGASSEIKKELSLAGSLNAPVFPVRLSPITPSGALRYELATRQWIDLFPDPPLALSKLVTTIRHVLAASRKAGVASEASPSLQEGEPPSTQALQVLAGALPREPVVAPASPQFEAIRTLLARHIGPIAKVIVQKWASEAPTAEDFLDKLAGHIKSPADRTAFLLAARAQLSVKS
jgi:hypothetical protein